MIQTKLIFLWLVLICPVRDGLAQPTVLAAASAIPVKQFKMVQKFKKGTVVTKKLTSIILRENRIGLNTDRQIKVYLPPGYDDSRQSYPVVYYCHTNSSSPEELFRDGSLVQRLEQGFTQGVVGEFIFVAADYSTTTGGGLYENSTTSGRWLDFTVQELVPFIDRQFRTLRQRNSRGLAGDFIGGRGALKLAMTNASSFGVVYALHPVATGMGYLPWAANDVNWQKIHQAKTFAELAGEGRAQMFVAMAQATLPNPDRPPFYCDFWVELENNEPKLHVENTQKAQTRWLLDRTLEESAGNLRQMRGIAFDWGRYDPTPTHVYANQAFSRKLEDLGIEHEAEEYRGNPWNKNWTETGRFYTRMLPFFARHLVFEGNN
jgi:enterochelin esterase-like enzyme